MKICVFQLSFSPLSIGRCFWKLPLRANITPDRDLPRLGLKSHKGPLAPKVHPTQSFNFSFAERFRVANLRVINGFPFRFERDSRGSGVLTFHCPQKRRVKNRFFQELIESPRSFGVNFSGIPLLEANEKDIGLFQEFLIAGPLEVCSISNFYQVGILIPRFRSRPCRRTTPR